MQKNLTIEEVRQNIIGFNTQILTPFGQKTCVYADHTATGRPFQLIEKQIQDHIKKMIANSHTEISAMGEYSTQLLDYAQDSILKSFGVNNKEYFAIPAGFGATGAFEKLSHLIPIKQNDNQSEQPIVYISPYEHHSNILFWVENNCQVITIESNDIGAMNLNFLEKSLQQNKDKIQIVTVSAASNVTSQKTDIKGINNIIKKNKKNSKKVYFCLDCAALLSHDRVYLNQPDYDQIDFLSSSPHKNLGGSESTGLLIGKKSSYGLNNQAPSFPGGGTVTFVTGTKKEDIEYEKEIFFREQAGTPNAIGFYRAALSFELEDQIGLDVIKFREDSNQKYFMDGLKQINKKLENRKIQVYGENNKIEDRYDVFSFNILAKEGLHLMDFEQDGYKFLHPHFVAKVLNDVYGIQVRSGCSCAGPFGIKLLKIPKDIQDKLKQQVINKDYSQKPGWVRLDTFFAFEKYEIEYMLQAIEMVAQKSDYIASQYVSNNGAYVHKNQDQIKENDQFDFALQSDFCSRKIQETPYQQRKQILKQQLELGKEIFGLKKKNIFNIKKITNSSSKNINKLNDLQKSFLLIPKKNKLPQLKMAQIQQAYQTPWLGKSNNSSRLKRSVNFSLHQNSNNVSNLNDSKDTKDSGSYVTYHNSNNSSEDLEKSNYYNKKNNNYAKKINLIGKGSRTSRAYQLQQQENQKQENLLKFIKSPKQQKQIHLKN